MTMICFKKLLLSLIALSLFFTACTASFFANASSDLTINVSSVKAKPGDTVDVVISIPVNPGIAIVGFNVDYDSENLTLNSITAGEIYSESEMDGNTAKVPFMFMAYTGKNNKTATGELVTLNFTVSESAKAADYDIKIEGLEVLNIAEDPIDFTAVNGKITVESEQQQIPRPDCGHIPGDLNADGFINMIDLVILLRYIAGFDIILR